MEAAISNRRFDEPVLLLRLDWPLPYVDDVAIACSGRNSDVFTKNQHAVTYVPSNGCLLCCWEHLNLVMQK